MQHKNKKKLNIFLTNFVHNVKIQLFIVFLYKILAIIINYFNLRLLC